MSAILGALLTLIFGTVMIGNSVIKIFGRMNNKRKTRIEIKAES